MKNRDKYKFPIQLARGDLSTKQRQRELESGELFYQVANKDQVYFPQLQHDNGSVYIGFPSLDKGPQYSKILDIRSIQAFVLKGTIANSSDYSDEQFKTADIGDIFTVRGNKGFFYDAFQALEGDSLLVIACDKDENNYTEKKNNQYRVQLAVLHTGTDLFFQTTLPEGSLTEEKTTKKAIDKLDSLKLHFEGSITSLYSPIPQTQPPINTMYFVGVSGLVFPTQHGLTFKTTRGDFVVYRGSKLKWEQIKSGIELELDKIKYKPPKREDLPDTFSSEHKENIQKQQTLQEVLDFLAKNKAGLDKYGKIITEQIPDEFLGALIPQGVWEPLKKTADSNSKDLLEHQNFWPGYKKGSGTTLIPPKKGMYWIVNLPDNIVNVQYIDQNSKDKDGEYTRIIELNTGDWIVYFVGESSENFITQNNGYFAIVDNSNRISALNFIINTVAGEKLQQIPEKEVAKVGSITIQPSHKIGFYFDGSKISIGGIRLLDQDSNNPSKKNAVPKYTGDTTETLTNSSITEDESKGVNIGHDFSVGSELLQAFSRFFGDVYLEPTIDEFLNKKSSSLWFSRVDKKALLRQKLKNREDFEHKSEVTLPHKSSTLVGQLKDEENKPNYIQKLKILKGKVEPYVTDTALEEHLDNNGKAQVLESHHNQVTLEKTVVTQVLFRDLYNRKEPNDQGNPTETKLADIHIDPEQKDNTTLDIVLPLKSGHLFTREYYHLLIEGEENYLPIFSGRDAHQSVVLRNSPLYIKKDILLQLYQKTLNQVAPEYEVSKIFTDKTTSIEKDLQVLSNLTVGTVDNPKILGVTKGLFFGNTETNATLIVPGREFFKNQRQYNLPNGRTESPEVPVLLELPSQSGVLLNHQSVIDGGEFY